MQDCCLTCKSLEYRKNYVYPYRCLKHKAERFSEEELERMYFSGEECKDFEQRRLIPEIRNPAMWGSSTTAKKFAAC